MQEQGLIVAMTGDAVNDAAALKQADIGVAMGSGSEVTKQAARMILTDDNFGTLVHAVELGRRVYDKVVAYVRYQMTQLLALVLLFLAATAFDINEGVALTPLMVLYLLSSSTAAGVIVIALDPGDPDVMRRPPRDPKLPITNRAAISVLGPLRRGAVPRRARPARRSGPDEPSTDAERLDDDDLRGHGPRHGLQRADQPPRPGERAHRPDPQGAGDLARPVVAVVLATELPGLQAGCSPSRSPARSGSPASASPCLPLVIESSKWLRRRRAPRRRRSCAADGQPRTGPADAGRDTLRLPYVAGPIEGESHGKKLKKKAKKPEHAARGPSRRRREQAAMARGG